MMHSHTFSDNSLHSFGDNTFAPPSVTIHLHLFGDNTFAPLRTQYVHTSSDTKRLHPLGDDPFAPLRLRHVMTCSHPFGDDPFTPFVHIPPRPSRSELQFRIIHFYGSQKKAAKGGTFIGLEMLIIDEQDSVLSPNSGSIHIQISKHCGLKGDLYDVVGQVKVVNGQSLIDCPIFDEVEITHGVLCTFKQMMKEVAIYVLSRFDAYALHMEFKSKVKNATEIFGLRISRKAKSMEKLNDSYKKFMVRTMRRSKQLMKYKNVWIRSQEPKAEIMINRNTIVRIHWREENGGGCFHQLHLNIEERNRSGGRRSLYRPNSQVCQYQRRK
ncbi:hypothetical protein DY000_02041609 [Brassica cretica]|uniref:Uncharacterized protein n=1 Tax=Brassica cretica TaxID=69181 RepID=A0ABQ7B8B0_BRACR|nr:hypothetical protein DY000_02041609 [Brassica cretica]